MVRKLKESVHTIVQVTKTKTEAELVDKRKLLPSFWR